MTALAASIDKERTHMNTTKTNIEKETVKKPEKPEKPDNNTITTFTSMEEFTEFLNNNPETIVTGTIQITEDKEHDTIPI